MSYTKLCVDKPKKPKARVVFKVEMNLESEDHAKNVAKELRKLSKKLYDKSPYCPNFWATHLADIIEQK